jgi:hypothetical protein
MWVYTQGGAKVHPPGTRLTYGEWTGGAESVVLACCVGCCGHPCAGQAPAVAACAAHCSWLP